VKLICSVLFALLVGCCWWAAVRMARLRRKAAKRPNFDCRSTFAEIIAAGNESGNYYRPKAPESQYTRLDLAVAGHRLYKRIEAAGGAFACDLTTRENPLPAKPKGTEKHCRAASCMNTAKQPPNGWVN
jgi:hypothetical protein